MSYFYTKEEEDWLRANVDKYENSVGLTKEYNSKFGRSKKHTAIRKKISLMMPEHAYGFSGGQIKGQGTSVTALPIGAESWKGGYLYVKVADHPLPKNFTTEDRKKNWVAKHQYVWEQANGPIPDGHIVVFLDGNRSNIKLDNLYCVSRKVTTYMMRNKWFSENADITLTALKWCELALKLKEV